MPSEKGRITCVSGWLLAGFALSHGGQAAPDRNEPYLFDGGGCAADKAAVARIRVFPKSSLMVDSYYSFRSYLQQFILVRLALLPVLFLERISR